MIHLDSTRLLAVIQIVILLFLILNAVIDGIVEMVAAVQGENGATVARGLIIFAAGLAGAWFFVFRI